MADEPMRPAPFQLPIGVVTRGDVRRLVQEATAIDDFLRQAAIRQSGSSLTLPKSSQLLKDFLDINKLNMLQTADRQRVASKLEKVYASAPLLHMSFATDPSPLFLSKLMTWLRQQIHPDVLLQIGLQPSLGAGCVLRTTNKYFDFSLRQRFADQRKVLTDLLREAGSATPTLPEQPSQEPVS